MRKYVEQLYEQPKAIRSQVAMMAAATLTGLVFVGWLFGTTHNMAIESADPVVAAEQRKQAAAAAEAAGGAHTGVGSMISQIKNGAAAIFMSTESDKTEDTSEDSKNKTIDLNTLIQNSRETQPTPTKEKIVVPPGDGISEGDVILIGTTSAKTTENQE